VIIYRVLEIPTPPFKVKKKKRKKKPKKKKKLGKSLRKAYISSKETTTQSESQPLDFRQARGHPEASMSPMGFVMILSNYGGAAPSAFRSAAGGVNDFDLASASRLSSMSSKLKKAHPPLSSDERYGVSISCP